MVKRVTEWLVGVGPITFMVITCAGFIFAIMQLQPPFGDYGVFVSVGERLSAGDRLYAEVWDNKDPFFYYLFGIGRFFSPVGMWVVELIRVLLFGVAIYSISRTYSLRSQHSAFIGFFIAPIVAGALGGPIFSGLELAALVLAVSMRRHYILAGVILGLLLFTKLTLFPVALIMFSIVLITPSVRRCSNASLRGLTGFSLMIISFLTLLAIRGEFVPYFDALLSNLEYSQALRSGTFVEGILERIVQTFSLQARIVFVSIISFLALSMAVKESKKNLIPKTRAHLELAVLAGLLTALGVLAITAQWPHHWGLLALPASLVPIIIVSRIMSPDYWQKPFPYIALFGIAIMLAGIPQPAETLEKLLNVRGNYSAVTSMSLDGQLIAETGGNSSYARVGQGNDSGHAFGLRDWTLSCPKFHQYWWESERVLNETLSCLDTTQVILVAPSARDDFGTNPAWSRYLLGVEQVLKDSFSCNLTQGYQVCHRLPS